MTNTAGVDGALAELTTKIERLRELATEAADRITNLKRNIASIYTTIGAGPGNCRACQEPVWWVTTKNGNRAPFTADGLNHFADCPNAKDFRR